VIAALLKEQLVQYLNLSLNYLPALESLNKDPAMKRELCSYGNKLTLGFDNEMLVGEPDVDYWTQNAKDFKRIACGEEHTI